MQGVMGTVKKAAKRGKKGDRNGSILTYRGIYYRRTYIKGNGNKVSHY